MGSKQIGNFGDVMAEVQLNTEIDNYIRSHNLDPATHTIIRDSNGEMVIVQIVDGVEPEGSIRPRNSR